MLDFSLKPVSRKAFVAVVMRALCNYLLYCRSCQVPSSTLGYLDQVKIGWVCQGPVIPKNQRNSWQLIARRFLEVSYPSFTVVIKDSDTWWLYQVEAFSAFMSLVLSWSKILVESSYSKRLVRMVPHSLLQDPDQPLSAVRDELPYMDTDIARGLVSWLGSSVAKAPRFVNSLVKKGAPFMEEARSWENSKRHPKLSRINQSSFSTSHQTFRFWQLKITNFGPFFLVQAEIRT